MFDTANKAIFGGGRKIGELLPHVIVSRILPRLSRRSLKQNWLRFLNCYFVDTFNIEACIRLMVLFSNDLGGLVNPRQEASPTLIRTGEFNAIDDVQQVFWRRIIF